MKTILSIQFILLILYGCYSQELSPYFQVGSLNENIENAIIQVEGKIAEEGFRVLGKYKPGNQNHLAVIVFTNQQTQLLCDQTADQGMMAATYRIGLEQSEKGIAISTVNPEYQWRAYLTDAFEGKAEEFATLSSQYESFCKKIGNGNLIPFGGKQDVDDLEDYHYMLGMPYYDDQVKIGSFENFDAAIKVIESNLNVTSGITPVYSLKSSSKEVAVFGIGLTDPELGESNFLPIIGQSHVAAMPYELIIVGGEVSMLHGRFRFALYWPELTMGTFTKIMSTPGDVEELMKRLVN